MKAVYDFIIQKKQMSFLYSSHNKNRYVLHIRVILGCILVLFRLRFCDKNMLRIILYLLFIGSMYFLFSSIDTSSMSRVRVIQWRKFGVITGGANFFTSSPLHQSHSLHSKLLIFTIISYNLLPELGFAKDLYANKTEKYVLFFFKYVKTYILFF